MIINPLNARRLLKIIFKTYNFVLLSFYQIRNGISQITQSCIQHSFPVLRRDRSRSPHFRVINVCVKYNFALHAILKCLRKLLRFEEQMFQIVGIFSVFGAKLLEIETLVLCKKNYHLREREKILQCF